VKTSLAALVRISCAALLTLLIPISAIAADSVRHVSGKVPIQGNSRELAAERPAQQGVLAPEKVSPNANPWQQLGTIPGAVVHDIAFVTSQVGFAAAELGQVWKTTDGGTTWTEVMNLNFPYYWYGVAAAPNGEVIVSGFNDSNFEGIIRISQDGGTTWTSDIVLTTNGWSDRVRYINFNDGLVMDQLNLSAPNAAHYTTDGGMTAGDWTEDVPDPNGGWFGNEFSFLSNDHARASGITFCTTLDGGADWTCGPSVDSVFDGPVFFTNDTYGWVGGGEISPSVAGWVHRTTDGGNSWSGRTLNTPWPIREIYFLNSRIGWAAGGNYSSNVGGMYFSQDGGQTWSLDVNTGSEMGACDAHRTGKNAQIWCAGYNGSFNSVVYTLKGTLP